MRSETYSLRNDALPSTWASLIIKPNFVITFVFAILAASTEILSAFHAINKASIACLWAFLSLLLIAGIASMAKHKAFKIGSDGRSSTTATLIWAAVCCIVAVTLLLALSSAPTNYDSMTYHLARVEHWIQNGSLGFYPTHISRQLFSAPFAEILICHLELLTNSDRLCNIVQWACFVIAIFAAARIAGRLGGDLNSRAFAALFVSTLPMAILQSTGTQNDLVVTCFLMLLLDAYFESRNTKAEHLLAIVIGLDAGLAIYSKEYAYFFVVPILAAYSVRVIKTWKWAAVTLLAETAIASMVIVVPFFIRVFSGFGSLLYSGDLNAAVSGVTARQFLTKIVYDALSNMNYPVPRLGEFLTSAGRVFQSHMLPDDSGILYGQIPFQVTNLVGYDPDFIGNPVHIAIILCFLAVLLCSIRSAGTTGILEGLLLVGSGYLLETAALRWQPWITRLEMAGFMMMMPLAAVVLQRRTPRLTAGFAIVAFVGAVPCCLENVERPLINVPSPVVLPTDRTSRMFVAPYRDAIEAIIGEIIQRKANRIGLAIGGDDWEYPYWALLRASSKVIPTIHSVCVSGPNRGISEELPDGWHPEVVVVQKNEYRVAANEADPFNAELEINCPGATYRIVNSYRVEMSDRRAILSLYALKETER